jgi:hypothetical protein
MTSRVLGLRHALNILLPRTERCVDARPLNDKVRALLHLDKSSTSSTLPRSEFSYMAVRTTYRRMTTPMSRPSRSGLPFAHGHVLTSWPPFPALQVPLRIGIRQRSCSSSIRVQRTDLIIHRFTIWICGREFAIESLPGYARYTEISSFWKKHLDKSFDASMLLGKAWAPAFWCCTLDDTRPSTLLSAFSSCFSNFHFSF